MTTKTSEVAAVLERTRPVGYARAPAKCAVLLSGGIDSTVLMYSLISEYECYPLTIDYGQLHRKEVLAARNVCEARGDWLLKRWKYLNLSNLRFILPSALTGVGKVPSGKYDKESMGQTVVPNRNMIFLAIAAGYAEGIGAQYVACAVHTEDHYLYPDTRPNFAIACDQAIKEGTGNKVHLLTPFISITKADIITFGKTFTVPFKLTWSCYKGEELHCGVCGTCVERKKAFKLARVADPTVYANRQMALVSDSIDGRAKAQYAYETQHPERELELHYKELYNEEKGIPEPTWGEQAVGLQCPTCSSQDMYYSGSPDDPEEVFPYKTVRCGNCGHITDWYEARKQRENHPTDEVKEVIK